MLNEVIISSYNYSNSIIEMTMVNIIIIIIVLTMNINKYDQGDYYTNIHNINNYYHIKNEPQSRYVLWCNV